MGKTKRGDKEFTREKQLVQENRTLKRQVSSLRKQLARVDLDRYSNLKETIEKHCQEDETNEQSSQSLLDKVKQEWACHEPDCGGFLEIFLYSKVGTAWYYRVCSNAPRCKNRTVAQKHTPEVKGIVKKATQLPNT